MYGLHGNPTAHSKLMYKTVITLAKTSITSLKMWSLNELTLYSYILCDGAVSLSWRITLCIVDSGKGGKGPPARTGHSCTVLADGRLLIFGGIAESGKHVNDMFLIDVKRLTWYKMAAKGAPPKGRAYHS